MAITSIKTGSSFTNLQKFDTAVASNPPLMAAPTATDGGTGSTASVAFTTVTGATSYGVLSSPGSFTATGTSSPLTVSGLTSGTAYTFQVRGVNSTSTGPYSAASNSVTPVAPSSFDSIATLSGSGVSTVTFSSIPSTYKHLQIRIFGQANSGSGYVRMRFNGDTGTNYAQHYLQGYGDGTGGYAGGNASTNMISLYGYYGNIYSFKSTIVDIADYGSTTKNKTVRGFDGYNSNGNNSTEINLLSGLWMNTSAITSITIYGDGGIFSSTTQFALYGIKG